MLMTLSVTKGAFLALNNPGRDGFVREGESLGKSTA